LSDRKNIFAIVGSASDNSANEKLVRHIAGLIKDTFDVTVFTGLKSLPHFDPALSAQAPPKEVTAFRSAIQRADGIIICTPEYVFSIPSGLKNAIEWCIATTVFSDKPTGLITASAHGAKGHEELQLIMKTAMAKFTDDTTLLIQGVKGKVAEDGTPIDKQTEQALRKFINAITELIRAPE
jgi:NAD(P)H-dependent FMN reductase